MNYSIFPAKEKATVHSTKVAVRGGDDLHNESIGQQIPFKTILGTSLIAMDKAIRVKLNLLFAQFTVLEQTHFCHLYLIILGRGSGMEASEEVFVSAENDDLFGTEALGGIRCSCCSHKVSLIPAKISVQ